MQALCLIYSTFPARDEAVFVARALLNKKLIACANVLGGATSLFRWEGEVKQEEETVMFAKTAADKVDEAIALINELHSYEVPCVVALPVDGGLEPFLDWVEQEVK